MGGAGGGAFIYAFALSRDINKKPLGGTTLLVGLRVSLLRVHSIMYWEDNICTMFLDGEGIARMLPYMTRIETQAIQRILTGRDPSYMQKSTHQSPQMMDPISNTIVAFITRPLSLILNEVGAMPFRDRPGLLFPYHLMNEGQKSYLRNCIQHTGEWTICNAAMVFQPSKFPQHVCPVTVLTTACQAIVHAKSKHDPKTHVGLCNIVLQRVQSHYPIDAPTQRAINQCVQGE